MTRVMLSNEPTSIETQVAYRRKHDKVNPHSQPSGWPGQRWWSAITLFSIFSLSSRCLSTTLTEVSIFLTLLKDICSPYYSDHYLIHRYINALMHQMAHVCNLRADRFSVA